MAQQKVPESPKLYTTRYKELKGLDVSRRPAEIDRAHACEMLNMRPDSSDGAPVKRVGWRTIRNFDYEIIGAYHDVFDNFDLVADQRNLWIVHEDEFTLARSFNTSASSVSMVHYDGLVYVMGWGEYFTVDDSGQEVRTTNITPKTPLTVISRLPDGTGGTNYEGVNALSDQRMISFFTKESSQTYRLYPAGTNDHIVSAVTKVEILGANGWVATAAYTFDSGSQTVTFTTAPPVAVEGKDNVRVTFTEPANAALRSQIINSRVVTLEDKRLFAVVGNNKIYYSDVEDLTFFPDDNYIVTGNDAPIIGLHKRNGVIYSVTGDSSEHSVFAITRSAQTINKSVVNADGSITQEEEVVTTYPVSASVTGAGAVAAKTFFPLVDDPLFLGKNGVYGITNNSQTSETLVAARSTNINPLIKDEIELKNAVATVYDGMYIVSINGKCFVLDSRNTYRDMAKNTCYESYYWDLNLSGNERLTAMLSYDGRLYFGTNGRRWCKFNTDVPNPQVDAEVKYKDDMTTNVVARYALRLDDDDSPQYYKTMQKKGCVLTLKPFDKTSVTAYYSKDGDGKQLIGAYTVGSMGWQNISFLDFTFISSKADRDHFIRKKIKKYKRLQIIFENTESEPFGISEFTKTWTVGNFAKG